MLEDFIDFLMVYRSDLFLIFIMVYISIEEYAIIIHQSNDYEEIMTYFFSIGRAKTTVIENNIFHLSYQLLPISLIGDRVVINKNKKVIYGPVRFLESIKKKLEEDKLLLEYKKGFYFSHKNKCKSIFELSTKLNRGDK